MVKSSRTKSHALIRLEQQSADSPDVPDSRTLQAFCAVKSQTISAFRQGLVNHARQGLVNHADRSGPGDFGLTSLFKLIAETARLRSRVSIGNIIPAGRQSREASNIYRRDQSRRSHSGPTRIADRSFTPGSHVASACRGFRYRWATRPSTRGVGRHDSFHRSSASRSTAALPRPILR